jgi:hypothetical protein
LEINEEDLQEIIEDYLRRNADCDFDEEASTHYLPRN